jgi:hypothetical protein
MTLNSNLRYRVVGVNLDLSKPRPLKGLSCGHTWTGFAWGKCPRCGDVAAGNSGDKYHWLDRKTNEPLAYKDGSEAQFDSLDEAISAFVDGKLSAERNEVLV